MSRRRRPRPAVWVDPLPDDAEQPAVDGDVPNPDPPPADAAGGPPQ